MRVRKKKGLVGFQLGRQRLLRYALFGTGKLPRWFGFADSFHGINPPKLQAYLHMSEFDDFDDCLKDRF